MEEWKEYRLGEICESVSESYRGKAEKVVLINTSDVLEGECLNHSKVPNKELKGQFKKTFKENDILYSEIRPVNRRYAYIDFFAKDYIASTKLMVLRHNEKVLPKYLYYILQSKDMIEELQMLAEARSGTFPQITFDVLSKECVMIPNINTQEKILAILTSLDNKIQLNRKINSNLEEQAKALYSKYASLAIGTARIGDLANEVLDYTPCTYPRVYLLNSSDISEGIFPKIELVDNKDLKGHFKKRFRFGDILYSQIRPRNHHYGLVLFEADRYISSTRLMIIRTKKEQISEYLLYQAIISPCVCDEFTLKTETRSGTFPQGNYKDMANIIIPYGTKEQREKIEPKLKVLREAIYSYQKENVILSSIRDALLPKLMSGEIEVK